MISTFALGVVHAGYHAANRYPGTPSTEVIDKSLAFVRDRMVVGWAVNEAAAVGVGVGHAVAGYDSVVTMKIPGVFQAGVLVIFAATDYVPSSTQHVVDARYFFASCRMPAVREWVEASTLISETNGTDDFGIIVNGEADMITREALMTLGLRPFILSLSITNPIPTKRIKEFANKFAGKLYIIEDGDKFLEEKIRLLGIAIKGKDEFSTITNWEPETVIRFLANHMDIEDKPGKKKTAIEPVKRPLSICPGCTYRAFGLAVQKLKRKKKLYASFGDIGCSTLLYFLNALDTVLCMGASDSMRQGFVLSRPDMASKVISVIGDSCECHSGLDSTRNAVFRNTPGGKVILDNHTTAMTGGQPAPSSDKNLAGTDNKFVLEEALCMQVCAHEAIQLVGTDEKIKKKDLTLELPKPEELKPVTLEEKVLPESLRVAIRGVGGQGNLFFGRVLSEMALRTPYAKAHIVKGDTHGMAQLGGPVISTFACGKVHSPVSAPNSADVLVVMETSEVLRPGFLDLLKPGGTIIMNTFKVVPAAIKVEDYPGLSDIKEMLKDYHVITIDADEIAASIGDKAGRSANAVVLGLLSTIVPFSAIPLETWVSALMAVSRKDLEKSFNYKAFKAGREYREEK